MQSAFRAGHSTESTLIKLTDEILFSMDQDKVTGMVFISMCGSLLLTKLRLYRMGDSALSMFKSYVTDRSQFVTVPQGSVLGPVLFLLFVNDIPLHLSHSSIDIFSDDTILSANMHWTDIPSMVQDINSDLDDINEWSAQNRMIIKH